MKTRLLTLALAVACAVSGAWAQEDSDQRRERENNIDITEIYNRQATQLAKQMKLNKKEKELFTILYLDYQNARHNAANPTGGDTEGAEQQADLKEITDDEALEMIEANFDRQEKQLAVDREYLPKFLEIITPAQAARMFLQQGMRPQSSSQRGQGGPGGGMGGPGGGMGGPGGGGPGGF